MMSHTQLLIQQPTSYDCVAVYLTHQFVGSQSH